MAARERRTYACAWETRFQRGELVIYAASSRHAERIAAERVAEWHHCSVLEVEVKTRLVLVENL